jgi:hypothetical protein
LASDLCGGWWRWYVSTKSHELLEDLMLLRWVRWVAVLGVAACAPPGPGEGAPGRGSRVGTGSTGSTAVTGPTGVEPLQCEAYVAWEVAAGQDVTLSWAGLDHDDLGNPISVPSMGVDGWIIAGGGAMAEACADVHDARDAMGGWIEFSPYRTLGPTQLVYPGDHLSDGDAVVVDFMVTTGYFQACDPVCRFVLLPKGSSATTTVDLW